MQENAWFNLQCVQAHVHVSTYYFFTFVRGIFFAFCFFGVAAGGVSRTQRKKKKKSSRNSLSAELISAYYNLDALHLSSP